MNRTGKAKLVLGVVLAAAAAQPGAVLACAACYGQSDSPLATGMTWGILSLLAVVVTVLSGIAGFGVYIVRRSAALSAAQEAAGSPEPPPSNSSST